jgi:hypothetical protein
MIKIDRVNILLMQGCAYPVKTGFLNKLLLHGFRLKTMIA